MLFHRVNAVLLLLRAYFLAKAYVVYDITAFGSATLLRWGAVVGSCYIFNSKNERKRGGSSTPSHGRYQRTGETSLGGFRIRFPSTSFLFLSLHIPPRTPPTSLLPLPNHPTFIHSFIHPIYHKPPIPIPIPSHPHSIYSGDFVARVSRSDQIRWDL